MVLRPLGRRLRRTLGRRAPGLCAAARRRRQRVHVRAFRRSAVDVGEGAAAAVVVTTVQGLPARPEPAAVLRALKKALGCGGSLVQDPRRGQVLYLQGDQRARARAYLVDEDRAAAAAAAACGRPLDPRAVVVHKGCEPQRLCPQCGYGEPRKASRWKLWTKCQSCGHRQWFGQGRREEETAW